MTEGIARGRPLGFPLGRARAAAEGTPGDTDLDDEELAVGRHFSFEGYIFRWLMPGRLGGVLQPRFWVDLHTLRLHVLEFGSEKPANESACCSVPVAEIHRTDESFEDAGEIPLTVAASGRFLASAQKQVSTEVDALRDASEGTPLDELRADASEVALLELREKPEEFIGDNEPEYGIAEILKAFVGAAWRFGFVEVGGVCERFAQEGLR